MDGWITAAWLVGGLLIGGVVGFFVARYYLKKQLEKNPPINEKMIRVMFQQMGRKPSEAQIKQIMNSMNQYK
ncbi:MAG: YneF family protein [Bacilli bacterium]|jgi:uncharacterized protein YneF (UPF0154 family)